MNPMFRALVSGAVIPVYDLSGITTSRTDKSISDQAGNYGYTFLIRNTLDATIDGDRVHNSDENNIVNTYLTPVNGKNLWVRCTLVAGTALNAGDATGSWHTLTSSQARSFGLTYTASAGAPDLDQSTIRLEIATDSGGTNIVATSDNCVVEVGNVGP